MLRNLEILVTNIADITAMKVIRIIPLHEHTVQQPFAFFHMLANQSIAHLFYDMHSIFRFLSSKPLRSVTMGTAL